jgi:hypothetical protein
MTPSEAERALGALDSRIVLDAARRFGVDGALLIENIVDPALTARARQAFEEKYVRYLDGSTPDEVLSVGNRRRMITIDLEPPFDDPRLFANPFLLPLLNSVLGEGFVLGAFGVVCSLPSALKQHRHRDGGILFPLSGIDRLLPTTAVTVVIPLLEMNKVNGTTELWLGSHRDQNRVSDEYSVEPVVHEGSCVIWDFRLLHGGTANRGTVPRPILYLVYCRPWFLDHVNYGKPNSKQLPIQAPADFLSGLSGAYRSLLARAR